MANLTTLSGKTLVAEEGGQRWLASYLPRHGWVVVGRTNVAVAEEVSSLEDAVAALRRVGFVPTAEWLTNHENGAMHGVVARA